MEEGRESGVRVSLVDMRREDEIFRGTSIRVALFMRPFQPPVVQTDLIWLFLLLRVLRVLVDEGVIMVSPFGAVSRGPALLVMRLGI